MKYSSWWTEVYGASQIKQYILLAAYPILHSKESASSMKFLEAQQARAI